MISLDTSAVWAIDPREMSKQAIERTRHVREVQRVDQQPPVADLPAGSRTHEAVELRGRGLTPVCRLPLEDAERTELAFGIENLLDSGRAEGADQLVLEVDDTY